MRDSFHELRWRNINGSLLAIFFLVFFALLFTTACAQGLFTEHDPKEEESNGENNQDPNDPSNPVRVLAPADLGLDLSGAQFTPPEMLALAEDYPSREVLSLDETKERLASDPDLTAFLDAMRAGGWNDEEIGEMLYMAAGHNSGQPFDPSRVRHTQYHDALHEAVDEFERALSEYEQEHGVRIDRVALQGRGVITTFSPEELP